MTLTISPRSVKAIRKPGPEPDINGTPRTAPGSVSTSDLPEAATLPDRTIWHIEDNAGGVWQVTVIGANGRISYGRPSASRGEVGGEVRFYRTPTAKHFDAVIPEVRRVWSQNVIVEKVGVTKETEEMMKEREKVDKERFETIIERVISKKDEEAEEAPW